MDARSFLGLQPTDHPHRFTLPVTSSLCSFSGNLFGGAALGAGIEAMELATGRSVLWATAQYVSFTPADTTVDLQVTLAAAGSVVTQARVTGTAGGSEVFTVIGALGSRPGAPEFRFADRPLVRRPGDCPERQLRMPGQQSINQHLEMRVAKGRSWDELDGTPTADGRSALWARMPGVDQPSASALAILGDWVPAGVGQALGQQTGGSSLDNTLRVVKLVPTEWVLLDIRVHAVHNGFAHGVVYQWAMDGTLLATASQSVKVRYADDKW
jgi:acyl-CoA thioesterase II